jgi:ATP-dependent RNA helicase DeaD
MSDADLTELLGPELAAAFASKGYTSLTAVQSTVLDPELAGRDLRITSQTGSGKTIAIGFSLRDLLQPTPAKNGIAAPRALVIAPTRELAKQVEEELSWLYRPLGARVASVTGGADYRTERRALASGPFLIVGTPGRMLDHLTRGSIDMSDIAAVVLDEADRMLDLGFREELEAILSRTPPTRRTHLVSATFPRDVRALADRVQRDAAHVEGTRLGAANVDIDHVIHVVSPHDRLGAIVNLLLANPEEQTIVFARTRADVATIASELSRAGFAASSISGEMEQEERSRALSAFKRGHMRVLVATDVAARGIDVQDIARVIQAEPPTDADSYTHRSGRTGRAGKKGMSSLFVAPQGVDRATRLLHRAGVQFRFEPIPSADSIRKASDARLFDQLTGDEDEAAPTLDGRTTALAERLALAGDVERTIARLLVRAGNRGTVEPREIRALASPRAPAPRTMPPPRQADTIERVAFRISWGNAHGADARRVLALVCRRGEIRGGDVGTIRIGRAYSVVEVAASVADAFEQSAMRPDPRDPRVLIRREQFGGRGVELDRHDDEGRPDDRRRSDDRPAPPREVERPREIERPREVEQVEAERAVPPAPVPPPAPVARVRELIEQAEEGRPAPRPREDRPAPRAREDRPAPRARDNDRPAPRPRDDRSPPRLERPVTRPRVVEERPAERPATRPRVVEDRPAERPATRPRVEEPGPVRAPRARPASSGSTTSSSKKPVGRGWGPPRRAR